LWQTCAARADLVMERASRRYLRLDRKVDGYARLSPSIRREFMTYVVIGLEPQRTAVEERIDRLQAEFVAISDRKRRVAQETIEELFTHTPHRHELNRHVCVLIGGDVVYDMAHAVERPEPSTGKMVRGSDLDLVFIADETIERQVLHALDERMYERKWHLLVLPQFREELDYVIKTLAKVRKQLAFDTFPHKVACKIMDEGQYLCGSRALFDRVKGLVEASGIPEKLAELEEKATEERAIAERELLSAGTHAPEWEHLFFTTEEREEIY